MSPPRALATPPSMGTPGRRSVSIHAGSQIRALWLTSLPLDTGQAPSQSDPLSAPCPPPSSTEGVNQDFALHPSPSSSSTPGHSYPPYTPPHLRGSPSSGYEDAHLVGPGSKPHTCTVLCMTPSSLLSMLYQTKHAWILPTYRPERGSYP